MSKALKCCHIYMEYVAPLSYFHRMTSEQEHNPQLEHPCHPMFQLADKIYLFSYNKSSPNINFGLQLMFLISKDTNPIRPKYSDFKAKRKGLLHELSIKHEKRYLLQIRMLECRKP